MKRAAMALAVGWALVGMSAVARANYCMELKDDGETPCPAAFGMEFAGSPPGPVRLKAGLLPTRPLWTFQIKPLHGRFCGTGTVYGTIANTEFISVGATFYCDGFRGHFDGVLNYGQNTGSASVEWQGTEGSCALEVIDCANLPQ